MFGLRASRSQLGLSTHKPSPTSARVSDGNPPPALPGSLWFWNTTAATCCSSHCHSTVPGECTKSPLPLPRGDSCQGITVPTIQRRKLRHSAKKWQAIKNLTAQFSPRDMDKQHALQCKTLKATFIFKHIINEVSSQICTQVIHSQTKVDATNNVQVFPLYWPRCHPSHPPSHVWEEAGDFCVERASQAGDY